MTFNPEPTATTWFPETKLDGAIVAKLAAYLMKTARDAGFSREAYAASIAAQAEAICAMTEDNDIDPEVKRFVAERLMAASIALSGGSN